MKPTTMDDVFKAIEKALKSKSQEDEDALMEALRKWRAATEANR